MACDPPAEHPACLDESALRTQCLIERTRGSGPGGQRKNKVETAIRLTHRPTGLSVTAGERRSQAENERAALRRLRWKLAVNQRHKPAPALSPRWRERTQSGQIALNPKHEDAPAMLAEAMDWIEAFGGDVAKAGKALGVSGSQLIKLLKIEPAALAKVNESRRQRGMGTLK